MIWILASILLGEAGSVEVLERPQHPSCSVPRGWENQLVLGPTPRNNLIRNSETVVVMCKEVGYTFVNAVYDIQGVYRSAVFFDSAVTITCKYGALAPGIFVNRTNWCDRGCPKAPTEAYTAVYGNASDPRTYLLQAEMDKAPVYPQPMELVRLKCKVGYAQIWQDKGSPYVRCNEGGYDRVPISCVAGCELPPVTTPEKGKADHVFDPAPKIYTVKDPPYSIGTTVTVLCNGDYKKSAPVTCTAGIGWLGSLAWQNLECRLTTPTIVSTSGNETGNTTSETDVFRQNSAEVLAGCPIFLLTCVMINLAMFMVY